MTRYNGVEIMARLSGLSEAEVLWTFNRLKALLAEGKTREEARAIVAREVNSRPWEVRPSAQDE